MLGNLKKPLPQDFSPPTASDLSEARLIEGLKKKEDWAYRFLIDQSAERFYRVAFRFLGKAEEAEDIVQEVLKKVVEKIDSFEGNSSIHTWLYRITVNECLMRLRSPKNKRTEPWEELLPEYDHGIRIRETADWSNVPDNLLDQKEFQDFLKGSTDALPEDLKTAYVLKDVEGLAEDEVCAILDLTKPAMKNRVHRARLLIREQIERKYVR